MVLRSRGRRLLQAGVDAATWAAAVVVAAVLRYEFAWSAVPWAGVVVFAGSAAVLQVAVGYGRKLYRGRYAYGSFDEVRGVTESVIAVTATLFVLALISDPRAVPVGVPVIAGVLALVCMLASRYVVRLRRERQLRPGDGAEPVIVFGAGEVGRRLVPMIQSDPHSPFRVVAVLDDDPALTHLRLGQVEVMGGRAQLMAVATATGATVLLVAIANADAALLREIHALAAEAGMTVKVFPSIVDLGDRPVTPLEVRDINAEDLLGRSAVQTDLSEIGSFLRGKRVLVTGAGGSIGSEIARQVHRFEPAALGLLDRDENGLHATSLSIYGRALLDDESTILASIRDAARIQEVFDRFRPDVVFHAAALKHQPLLERFPEEALKTNVWGTQRLLDAARASDVGVFVNISTDKAADPISVLGYSKRITERLTAAAGRDASGTYVSVRFGNVLASQGSVLHTFAAQIAAGGPVTVTHPDVTRYFMTIPEAVQLVLQAAAIGEDGEVLVLDMGQPVRIADVAAELIAQSGREIEIVFTGLREGEKLHEDLLGKGEQDRRPRHPRISQVRVNPLSPHSLVATVDMSDPRPDVIRTLSRVSRHGDVAPAVVPGDYPGQCPPASEG